MDILDTVSKAIVGITRSYGRRVCRKGIAPDIPYANPEKISGEKFRLGFARRAVMPDLSLERTYYIAGHGSGHVMKDILTPVLVHAVWLDCGGDEGMLWFSGDFIGMTGIEHNIIRKMVYDSKKIKGLKLINFSCTHSHSGIDTVGYWGKPTASIPANGKVDEYMAALYRKAVEAAEEAYEKRKSGRLFVGRTKIENGLYTKRRIADRHEIMTRFRFVPDEGRETWILNFGAHPNSLGGSNRSLSAEYPYFMRERIYQGRGANVLFGIGAIGGMDGAELEDATPLERVKYQSRIYAEAAMAMEDEKELKPEIKYLRQQFYLPVDNYVLTLLAMLGTMSFKPYPCPSSSTGVAMKSELTYMQIGGEKILTLPGENFVSTVYGPYNDKETSSNALDPVINPPTLAEICGDEGLTVFGVTNDMTGYVVPMNDWVLNPTQPYLNGTHDRFDENHYHETNSMGPNTQAVIAETFAGMVKRMEG